MLYLKSLFRGMLFGAGFAISAIVLFSVYKYAMINDVADNQSLLIQENREWNSLTFEQQIAEASVIAIIRYNKGVDGERIAYVDEIYKDNNEVNLKISVNDKYPSLNYYPAGALDRSGVVVFFSGTQARQRAALYLLEDRVMAYGSMPLNVLIKKFKEK